MEGETELRNFGRASLYDYFGDLVIYRNLEPVDARLPGLRSAAYRMDLTSDRIPRKLDREYAKAAVWFVEEAQRLRKVSAAIREILFVGDTRLNDGQAYLNMKRLGQWEGSCFIGAERPDEESVVDIDEDERIYVANRWASLGDWVRWLVEEGNFHLDERTVMVVDIDKTALGAKGRNDAVINKARLEGIYRTMDAVLGEDFDQEAFERQYSELNRSRYHFLTEDNQDYLAYICLVLNSGLIGYTEMMEEIQKGSLDNFEQFLRWVDSRMMIRPSSGENVRQVHEAVIASVRNGDPTPFKRFRRQEFICTVNHMGHLSDDSPVDQLLSQEITLTNEICELSSWLAERGCLLLCLSDKPDEASMPDRHDSAELPPVHKAQTHRVGTSIQSVLESLS
ncbi:MAG: hypothetical protein KatS3mg050_0568 [Litorilinea sp.]|nr:MAG: hypothetical protein KatS3mg050_0568 [Litorilinea sp.]